MSSGSSSPTLIRTRSGGTDRQIFSRCEQNRASLPELQGLEVNDFAKGKIEATVNELREERDAVSKLGLVD